MRVFRRTASRETLAEGRATLARVGLLLGGLVVAAGLAEVALRVADPPALRIYQLDRLRPDGRPFFRYDPQLGWRGRPNAAGRFDGTEFRTTATLSGAGFRDRARAAAKPAGTFRVAVFGDSITWGFGVEQGERFTDWLERRFRAEGRPIEVLNLGVSGYGTDQELLLYRAVGRGYCPDLVLVGLYANDLEDNASAERSGYAKPVFRLAGGRLVLTNVPVPRRSEAAVAALPAGPREAVKSWLRHHLRLYAAQAFARHGLAGLGGRRGAEAAVPDSAVQITAAILAEFEREAAAAGGRFAVALLPDLAAVAGSTEPAPPLARALARSRIRRAIDLTPAFRALDRRERARLFYVDNGAHWTARANAAAADVLAPFVPASLPPEPRRCS